MNRKYGILDNLIEGAQIISPDFRYLYVNNAVCTHAQKTREELVGQRMVDVFPGIDETKVFKLVEACLADGKYHELLNEFEFKDASVGYFELRIQPVPEGVLIMSFDVTAQVRAQNILRDDNARLEMLVQERTRDLHHANAELEKLVETDPLTGLYNRRYFDKRLKQEFIRCRRYNYPLSIALIDLDHFKEINDTYGHDIGDSVLKSFATLLTTQVRSTDSICRIGGEEFVLIMEHIHQEEAVAYAKRVHNKICGAPYVCEKTQIALTCSIGVAALSSEVRDEIHLLKCADSALYQAKNNGRNMVLLFEFDNQGI